jgi:hypothetical protein
MEAFEIIERKPVLFKLLSLCGVSQFLKEGEMNHGLTQMLALKQIVGDGFFFFKEKKDFLV